jgi:hypothetical protein
MNTELTNCDKGWGRQESYIGVFEFVLLALHISTFHRILRSMSLRGTIHELMLANDHTS